MTLKTPAALVTVEVTTKLRSLPRPYTARLCGFTGWTPAIVRVSPAFRVNPALVVKESVEVEAQPVASPWPPPFTVTAPAAVVHAPKVCETTFWSIFQFMPAESRPIRPFVYWAEILSGGTNRPLRLSTIEAEVKGSTTTQRFPSRGAPSESSKAAPVR